MCFFKGHSCFKLFRTNRTFETLVRPLNKMADLDAIQVFLPSSDIVK